MQSVVSSKQSLDIYQDQRCLQVGASFIKFSVECFIVITGLKALIGIWRNVCQLITHPSNCLMWERRKMLKRVKTFLYILFIYTKQYVQTIQLLNSERMKGIIPWPPKKIRYRLTCRDNVISWDPLFISIWHVIHRLSLCTQIY